jgi:hypothetical protein
VKAESDLHQIALQEVGLPFVRLAALQCGKVPPYRGLPSFTEAMPLLDPQRHSLEFNLDALR